MVSNDLCLRRGISYERHEYSLNTNNLKYFRYSQHLRKNQGFYECFFQKLIFFKIRITNNLWAHVIPPAVKAMASCCGKICQEWTVADNVLLFCAVWCLILTNILFGLYVESIFFLCFSAKPWAIPVVHAWVVVHDMHE